MATGTEATSKISTSSTSLKQLNPIVMAAHLEQLIGDEDHSQNHGQE